MQPRSILVEDDAVYELKNGIKTERGKKILGREDLSLDYFDSRGVPKGSEEAGYRYARLTPEAQERLEKAIPSVQVRESVKEWAILQESFLGSEYPTKQSGDQNCMVDSASKLNVYQMPYGHMVVINEGRASEYFSGCDNYRFCADGIKNPASSDFEYDLNVSQTQLDKMFGLAPYPYAKAQVYDPKAPLSDTPAMQEAKTINAHYTTRRAGSSLVAKMSG
jgi:hypothetical protein